MCQTKTDGQNCLRRLTNSDLELFETLYRLREILNNPPISRLLDEIQRSAGLPQQQLLDERDAAALLGIPAKTLGNIRRRGELPPSTYIQRGRRCRVRYVRDALLLCFKINPHSF